MSVPHSHIETTTFRSIPAGRGGASGTAPAAMRSLQLANICRPRLRPNRFMTLVIWPPRWPICTRWFHASRLESNCARLSISRMIRLPSWWQSMHPCFCTSSHWSWCCRLAEMPLPSGPVPGNSACAGGRISEYQ